MTAIERYDCTKLAGSLRRARILRDHAHLNHIAVLDRHKAHLERDLLFRHRDRRLRLIVKREGDALGAIGGGPCLAELFAEGAVIAGQGDEDRANQH